MSSLTSRLAGLDRRVYAAVAVVVILLLGGIGGTLGYAAYQDSQPTSPTFNLKNGQKEVPLTQRLVLTLKRPAPVATVTSHFHIAPAVDGVLDASADRRTFTWTAAGPWADLTAYTVRVSQFSDDRGIAVRAGTWSFTTTIVPRVTALTTDSGTAIADNAELPLGSNLKVAFNAAMDATSVKLLANGNPVSLAWDADGKSAAFGTKGIPVGPLALSLGPGGHDTVGHALATDWAVTASLVFRINVHTTPLPYPALIQIPNDPGAWDQSGLQSANIVFESVAEGGITRFTAVFQQVPDKVGPVRSGRLISLKLTRHYHGRLFLSGTSQGTFGVLNSDPVPTFFDTQGYYYRTSDHRAPDNLYINADAIARAQTAGPPGFTLTTGTPKLSGGQPANDIKVPEHSTTFSLEQDSKTYLKTEDGHQFGDASIGQPLRISMVIVLRTQVTTTGIIEDVNGAHGLDYNIDGSGSADVYYQGLKYGAHWSSPDRGSPLVFTTDAGQAITLPSGLVWVEVVPG
ncbi:MAG TPA: DUF3048 domain-containing protein [Candidatus Dormibacteraeota bacterium]